MTFSQSDDDVKRAEAADREAELARQIAALDAQVEADLAAVREQAARARQALDARAVLLGARPRAASSGEPDGSASAE